MENKSNPKHQKNFSNNNFNPKENFSKDNKNKIETENKKSKSELAIEEINLLSKRILNELPPTGKYSTLTELQPDMDESKLELWEKPYSKFKDLPISSKTLQGLNSSKYFNLTPIQRCTLPHSLGGRDILGASKTGSGKTLCFLIPLLENLYRDGFIKEEGLGALILLPTRELAIQVFEVINKIGKHHNYSVGLVIGGNSYEKERYVVNNMNILIGTPGRILQHMAESYMFTADNLKILVIDEADRILDEGFEDELIKIINYLPKNRQTLLFSATLTRNLKRLIKIHMRSPEYINLSNTDNVLNTIENNEIKVISQKLNILKWEKEFEDTLILKQQKDLELFPVDKVWFEEYKNSVLSDEIPMNKKIENYNSFKPLNNANILHDKNSINPNSNFIFLNKQSMDDFSPSILSQKQFNIKIIGRFYNGKMISRIGKNLYYCFFIDNDKINEGIFMFGNIDISSINPIINEFLNSNFEIFINKYFHENDISSNNHFYVYHRNDFDFLIKKNENNDNYYRASNLKKINIPKNMKNKENNNVNNKQNFKQIIPSKIKFIKTDNKSILNNELEKKYINPLEPTYISNLSKCILEFYYSEHKVNDFINDKNKFHYKSFKIINEKWLNKFKNIILYDQIKLKLSNENNSLKYKEIISDFINNNININDIRIDYIPLTKKIISNKNGKEYFYYNNFQLLTKNSFSEFCKTFHFQIINKEFNTFLLDKKNIFIQYDENCGEILYYNDSNFEHNYFLISDYHLKEILNFLQKNGLERGLSFYGFKGFNGYIKEWKLTDKNNQIIGILKILNNNIKFNKYNNYNSDEEIINNDENVLGNNSNMKTKEIPKKIMFIFQK